MSTSSLSPLRSPTPEPVIPVQPDHFYGQSGPASPDSDKGFLDPADDPLATRGIPVFKPALDDFKDFEAYVTRLEPWGMKSGIVKIIPPKEWTAALPSTIPQLAGVKLRNPIEQEMVGRGGLFRQQNVEKRRVMSVREWAEMCAREDLRAPTREEAQTGRRHTALPAARTTRARRPRPAGGGERKGEESIAKDKGDAMDGTRDAEVDKGDAADEKQDAADATDHADIENRSDGDGDTLMDEPQPDTAIDPASTLPSPPHTTASPTAAPSPSPQKKTKDRSAADAARRAADATFLETFDPHKAWLPQDTSPDDYTPELCRALERFYWRNCSLGRAPWYGADMKGSLFTQDTAAWNVASLPSALSRLLRSAPISGVNTPYLYFGMWRATFAWHVEDMDLFSINYIHFGAAKHWYAVPQGRAQALETTMKGYFPRDNTQCPQFLRHKSFLASPTLLAQSSVRPNVLVQHAGEFVITFPRGYHAGFNLGFNCAESVNFALESWIEMGLKAAWCTCEADSVRIDVKGLLEAKDSKPEPEKQLKKEKEKSPQKTSPPRKRKVDPAAPTDGPAPKRTKPVPAAAPKAPKPVEPEVPFMCCLCASPSTEDLLRVHDPPGPGAAAGPPPPDGVWRAHASCARVVPETWVDEGSGAGWEEAEVWGVDGIVRDRWALKCAACTRPRNKMHGAPIQCTKGKCSKAFHVSCAAAGAASASYRVVEELEKEVVLLEPELAAPAPNPDTTAPAPAPRVIKTIKKLSVEVLCSQHNPAHIAQKKASKDDKVRRDLFALPPMSRIRIRNSSGVFEVSLVKVCEEKGTVEVLWDGGGHREFRWGSVVWGTEKEPVGRKPTAEEVAKQPPPPPPAPTHSRPQQQQYNPYSQPGPSRLPPSYSYTPPQQQGMGQFRVAPPPQPQPSAYNYSAPSPYQGYYQHPYYQHNPYLPPGGSSLYVPPGSSSSDASQGTSSYARSPQAPLPYAGPGPSSSTSPQPPPQPQYPPYPQYAPQQYAPQQYAPQQYANHYQRPYLPLAPRPAGSSTSHVSIPTSTHPPGSVPTSMTTHPHTTAAPNSATPPTMSPFNAPLPPRAPPT